MCGSGVNGVVVSSEGGGDPKNRPRMGVCKLGRYPQLVNLSVLETCSKRREGG